MKKESVKRSLVFGIVVLFICINIFSSTGTILEKSTLSFDGKTLYVGGDGEGNYSKIQDAIDNASDGDTVFVFNGTYVENLVVNKSINLIGEDRNITFVDGNDKSTVVNVTADYINVTDFTIQNGNKGFVVEANHSTISDNNISAGLACIKIGPPYYFSQNTFSNNILRSDIYGIIVWGFGSNIISGNIIRWYSEIGIHVVGNDNIISENTFLDSESTTMGDIFIDSGQGNLVINNTLVGSKGTGIRLHYATTNTILGNTISNKRYGIYIALFSINNNISGNAILENRDGIIITYLSISNMVYRNNFINNNYSASFGFFSFLNNWDGNYWGRPRVFPYPIIGRIGAFIPWVNFDWRPAQEKFGIP